MPHSVADFRAGGVVSQARRHAFARKAGYVRVLVRAEELASRDRGPNSPVILNWRAY